MSSIMGVIGPERSKLFALELRRKMLHSTFFFTIAFTNINQLTNWDQTRSNVYGHEISDEFVCVKSE